MKRLPWKPIFLLVVIAAGLVLGKHFHIQARFGQVLDWVSGLGMLAPLVFGGLYILACVFFIPGLILTLGGGALFGIVKGTVIVSIASTVGATVAFLIGRYLARDVIAKKTEGNQKFKAIDDAVSKEGWKIVGLMRLSPIFPFNFLNYLFGLTKVSLKDYVLASWIGMLPGTVLYVYLGSLAGSLAAVSAGHRTKSPAEWLLYAAGLAATAVVTIFVTRIAKKALAQKVS